MEKVATGAEARDVIDVTAPPEENIRHVAKAKGVRPEEVVVTILDRPRHRDVIQACRDVGARVLLIRDGDVAGAISAALKCLGGSMQGRLFPRNEGERRRLLDDGYDLERVLATDDLVAGDDVFFAATGVTDGALLEGVKYWPDGATTYSLVMRARSGTIRMIEAEHQFEKLERFTGRTYRR